MPDLPRSLTEFEQRFGDEDTCAEYLAAARWPGGFSCPGCAGSKAWRLESKPWTYECARCGRQTSITAGTILHHSKLPLTAWFWAAYVMATQPNGISALQLQRELSLGSYKTAWLLCAKLRRAMVAPARNPLSGLVEVDKTEIAYRSKNDPVTTGGSNQHGKMLIVGAVEVQDLRLGRIRLTTVPDDSAASLHAFLAANLAPGTSAQASGKAGYCGVPGINHDPLVMGALDPQKVRPRVHRIFSDLKVWALSVYHGLRRKHLQSYLDEFVFRFNRRRNRDAAFLSLLGIAAAHQPLTYRRLASLGATA
jgi:ISXO2-like transposase domain/Transposase zinc-ribbon domain